MVLRQSDAPHRRAVVPDHIEPTAQGADKPQTAALAPHLARATGAAPGAPSDAGPDLGVVPNPARGRTRLTLRLDAPADVSVDLVDSLGRIVRRVAAGPRPAGASSVALDVSGLAPGIYAVRLRAGASEATRLLAVVR